MEKKSLLSLDAFARGQIGSKIWLCQELEKLTPEFREGHHTIWCLGGWYCMSIFLLYARESIEIEAVVNFDLDVDAGRISEKVNDLFMWESDGAFKFICCDANEIDYANPDKYQSPNPTLVINTAVEHMVDDHWYDLIPKGTLVILQSCNMEHEEHVNLSHNLDDFKNKYSFERVYYAGEKTFAWLYFSFSRYMVIGVK